MNQKKPVNREFAGFLFSGACRYFEQKENLRIMGRAQTHEINKMLTLVKFLSAA
jgi:hypothetical protein